MKRALTLCCFAALAAPAAAHENPYIMESLTVVQADIPKVRVGYTAVWPFNDPCTVDD